MERRSNRSNQVPGKRANIKEMEGEEERGSELLTINEI